MRDILIKTIQKTPFMAETVIIKKLKPSLQMTTFMAETVFVKKLRICH